MELRDAFFERRSIRGYKDTPVSKELLTEILETATRCVSAKNMQPWFITVVTGEPLKQIKEINAKRFAAGEAYDTKTDSVLYDEYKERAKTVGIGLFKLMDIGREDKDKRDWWSSRGFEFFGAPAVILISMDEGLPDTNRLDQGSIIQSICLAATDKGLGTCVEYQAISYNSHYYDILGIPKTRKFICGISIGYEDPSFAANAYISEREDVNTLTEWVGF